MTDKAKGIFIMADGVAVSGNSNSKVETKLVLTRKDDKNRVTIDIPLRWKLISNNGCEACK